MFDGFFKKETTVQTVKEDDIFECIRLKGIDIPTPKESRGKDWVLYGVNNSFPLDLIEYKDNSSLHDSIIESKTNLIAGNGFLYAETRELSDEYLIDNWKQVQFHHKLDDIFWLVARDQETFGYSCFEVIYSMDRSRIADINWIDASRIACGKRDDNGDINYYYYSDNWADLNNNKPRKIDAFDPNGDALRQLVFIKRIENNQDFYSKPNYLSALKWIKADGLMSDYNLSAISNGFSPSIVFKFYKKPSPEERRMNQEAIKAQYSGVKNAGKALTFYSDGKELAPDVIPLDVTNVDSRLLTVADQIVQQIITAHRAHPQLLGIQTPGKLGYSSELLQSWEIFNSQVIKPERKLILDAFKRVLTYNGVLNVSIEEITPIKIIEQ